MNDRELFELAARASGYNAFDGHAQQMIDSGWNPLADDGDAFRLMCQLSMRVYVYKGGGDDYTIAATDELTRSEILAKESHNIHGVEAATRRAIVMAAAEIGKSK